MSRENKVLKEQKNKSDNKRNLAFRLLAVMSVFAIFASLFWIINSSSGRMDLAAGFTINGESGSVVEVEDWVGLPVVFAGRYGASSYEWTIEGLDNGLMASESSADFEYQFDQAGEYRVKLTVLAGEGEQVTQEKTLKLILSSEFKSQANSELAGLLSLLQNLQASPAEKYGALQQILSLAEKGIDVFIRGKETGEMKTLRLDEFLGRMADNNSTLSDVEIEDLDFNNAGKISGLRLSASYGERNPGARQATATPSYQPPPRAGYNKNPERKSPGQTEGISISGTEPASSPSAAPAVKDKKKSQPAEGAAFVRPIIAEHELQSKLANLSNIAKSQSFEEADKIINDIVSSLSENAEIKIKSPGGKAMPLYKNLRDYLKAVAFTYKDVNLKIENYQYDPYTGKIIGFTINDPLDDN